MRQLDFEAAFCAADEQAEQEQRRQQFRQQLISGLHLPESVEKLLLALDALTGPHGFTDEQGNNWLDPSKFEIAEAMEMSVDTARRSWKQAERLGLIEIRQVVGRTNVFKVLWPVIFERAATPSAAPQGGGSRGGRGGGSRGSKRGLASCKNGNTGGGSIERLHEENEMNMNLHEFMKDEDLEIGPEERPAQTPPPGGGRGSPRRESISLVTVDPERNRISIDELADPHAVQRLWQLCLRHPALQAKYRDDDYHRRLFYQIASLVHRKQDKLRNPIGFFHEQLLRGEAALKHQTDDDHDLKWARNAMAIVDGRQLPRTSESTSSRKHAAMAGEVLRTLARHGLDRLLNDEEREALCDDPLRWRREQMPAFLARCRELSET